MTGASEATAADAQLERLLPELAAHLEAIPDYRPGDVDAIRATMAGAFGSGLPAPDEVVVIDAGGGRGVELRIHRPSGAESGGALLHVHGGGFVMGSAALYDGVCRELADLTSCTVVAV